MGEQIKLIKVALTLADCQSESAQMVLYLSTINNQKAVPRRTLEASMTKLSLVIPALNEEKFLPHLLTSLTKQTKRDFEVAVVDGSSKDRTVDTARSFCSSFRFSDCR
jgi:cellulose synthase/poly-beta-1,6-N-acetylglucosamine synthase-like glycosyltransferase